MLLDALLPERLAVAAFVEEELDDVAEELGLMKLDDEPLSLETQLPDLRPRERVDVGLVLNAKAQVANRQVEWHP